MDACAVNLMRPAMGAYTIITVMGQEDEPMCPHVRRGRFLCENNDKFAIDRMLPEIKREIFCLSTMRAPTDSPWDIIITES